MPGQAKTTSTAIVRPGVVSVVLILGLTGWIPMARLVRGYRRLLAWTLRHRLSALVLLVLVGRWGGVRGVVACAILGDEARVADTAIILTVHSL